MKRTCLVCEEEFDPNSTAKRRVGGLIGHCPSCSNEPVVRSVGVANGDGKQASVSIVRPATNEDRAAFLSYWRQAVGMHRGKSCQLDSRLTAPAFNITVVSAAQATNHKGRL